MKKIFRKLFKKNKPQIIGRCVNKREENGAIIYTIDLSKEGQKYIKKILKNYEEGFGFND